MGFYHNVCVTLGLIALAHAAYSAAQHRTYIRLTEQEFTRLPLDILLQCILGLLLTSYGVVHITGYFKEIKASAELENKSWEMLGNRQAFYTFNHRGKALYAHNET
ncbi:ER membrane protein complex subunit 5-like [Gigantopelta aegis]|uniref:ER membrane protein complex subunit 5-like n=1 Tax=Gigantopelta aegis TaxID=1735272 RepID=UPI001B88D5AA|nr:ER membrane protein complex subunit 5-like [Gigantopelta aegis]